jgi:hypothetical protein
MKKIIIVGIVAIIGVFGLLMTETIDLKDNSSNVRKYSDLKERQNVWIAENCDDEICNDGKTVSEKIDDFIEENRNYFDKNGFNMYGFDKNGFNKQGITEAQSTLVREAYERCTAGVQQNDGCDSMSGELCMVSSKSTQYESCNQQSKIMTSQFVIENQGN